MKYDLIIVGGGPAGYSAAFKAVEYGMKTLLIEKDALGGTCLNRGCIPTKYLEHTANLYHQIKASSEYGIFVEKTHIDFPAMQMQKNEIISKLRNGLLWQLQQKKLKLFLAKLI